MLRFPAPNPLNGAGLVYELRNAGVVVSDVGVTLAGDNVEIDTDADRSQVEPVVLAHTGALTPTQQARATSEVNRSTLEQRADQALTTNADYLAIASPTNAQNLAQIRALTRECSALIRLLLRRLDTTD